MLLPEDCCPALGSGTEGYPPCEEWPGNLPLQGRKLGSPVCNGHDEMVAKEL